MDEVSTFFHLCQVHFQNSVFTITGAAGGGRGLPGEAGGGRGRPGAAGGGRRRPEAAGGGRGRKEVAGGGWGCPRYLILLEIEKGPGGGTGSLAQDCWSQSLALPVLP